jgi:hypothetical protein
MRNFAVVLFLLLAALSACVAERSAPPVIVAGERIFAPPRLRGVWARDNQRLHIQPPPAPGFVVAVETAQGEERRSFFDITRIESRAGGIYVLQLRPLSDNALPDERTFELTEQGLVEWRGTDRIVWRSAGAASPERP